MLKCAFVCSHAQVQFGLLYLYDDLVMLVTMDHCMVDENSMKSIENVSI